MEFGIPAEHPAWSKAAPEVEQLDPLKPYSPFVLPNFYEEEYLKEPVDKSLEKTIEVVNASGNLGPNAVGSSVAGDGSLDADAFPNMYFFLKAFVFLSRTIF